MNRKKSWLWMLFIIGILAVGWFICYSYHSFQISQAARKTLAEKRAGEDNNGGREQQLRAGTEASGDNEDDSCGRDNGKGEILYKGKVYRRNTAVRAILCIGVDTEGEMEAHTDSGSGGQADGVFLVAQDAARDRVKILLIPRDTMTEITLFDLSGNELGKDIQHLTLQYAYGDGREKSGELMKEAVSNLLCNLKIDGYLAVNISAIPILNDAVGGVTVTVLEEGLEQRDPELAKGKTVTLMGGQAETFVRYRDTKQAQSAIGRMSRQKQYMQGYLQSAKKAAAQDDSLIPKLMDQLQKYMVTDMPKDQYLDMGLAVINSQESLGDGDFLTVPGEAVETELFDEYHVDRERLIPVVLELFYLEK